MIYVLPLLFFCFSMVCSSEDIQNNSEPFIPNEFFSYIVDCFGSQKKNIVMPDNSEKKEDVPLKEFLELRAINKDFDQKILLFFGDLFHFSNRTSFSNGTMLNQVGNIVKIIGYCNIPDDFTFIKSLNEKISREENKEKIEIFVPKKMRFLNHINKEEVEFCTVKTTGNADYYFFQGQDAKLLQNFISEYSDQFKNKKKYAIFPVWHTSSFPLPEHIHRSSFFKNFYFDIFYQDCIRIPNHIFDGEMNEIRIFAYEDGCKVEDNVINFISLYLLFDKHKNYGCKVEIERIEKDIIDRLPELLKLIFRRLQAMYDDKKNIIDLNLTIINEDFVNESFFYFSSLEKIRDIFNDFCTDNFIIRSVFDKNKGDLYLDNLLKKVKTKLKEYKKTKKEKRVAITILPSGLAEDFISYYRTINPKKSDDDIDDADTIEKLLRKLKKDPKQKKKKNK